MRSDICEQGQTNKPLRVGKMISTGEVLLTEEGGDLLLQVAHAGQHGSMTQPANLTKVKQVTIVCVDFVRWNWRWLRLRERMELTTFMTTNMTSVRLADLEHKDSWWMMQCTLRMGCAHETG